MPTRTPTATRRRGSPTARSSTPRADRSGRLSPVSAADADGAPVGRTHHPARTQRGGAWVGVAGESLGRRGTACATPGMSSVSVSPVVLDRSDTRGRFTRTTGRRRARRRRRRRSHKPGQAGQPTGDGGGRDRPSRPGCGRSSCSATHRSTWCRCAATGGRSMSAPGADIGEVHPPGVPAAVVAAAVVSRRRRRPLR